MSFPHPKSRPKRTSAKYKMSPQQFLKRLDEGRMIDRSQEHTRADRKSSVSIPVPDALKWLKKKEAV